VAVALCLVGVDRAALLEGQRDVVEPVEQPPAALGSSSNGTARPSKRTSSASRSTSASPASISARTSCLRQHDRQQADLRAVGEEDVGEARRDDRAEAVVLQRPGRVLAARAAAEVRAGGEDRVGGRSQPGSFAQS
jgi:hypothetical protein